MVTVEGAAGLPVELVPPVTVPVSFSHFFHRSSGSSTQDHWDAEIPRSCRGGDLSLGMENALYPNRGQKQRGFEFLTEDGCLGPIKLPSLKPRFRKKTGGTSKLRAVQFRSMRGIMAHLLKALRLAS